MAERQVNRHYEVLLIGGSAGSLEVLLQVLPTLRPDLDIAIIIVVHRKNTDSLLVELLNNRTNWKVKEAEDKEPIIAGTIYIAPADYHLLIERNHTFSLDDSEKLHYSRPAIDSSFETAAEAYGASLAALLLSGANADGTNGLMVIREFGGLTIVQDPEDATVAYMPSNAIKSIDVDHIATTTEISRLINHLNKKE